MSHYIVHHIMKKLRLICKTGWKKLKLQYYLCSRAGKCYVIVFKLQEIVRAERENKWTQPYDHLTLMILTQQ